MHWVTDVLGGAAMATAVLALWSVVRRSLFTPDISLPRHQPRPSVSLAPDSHPSGSRIRPEFKPPLHGRSRTVVVIPTYNEAGNVTAVLDQVRAAAPGVDILVVDDNSPDGTATLVTSHRGYSGDHHVGPPDQSGRVFLLSRTAKNGIGAAYRAGFSWALDRDDAIVQMDADLSHPPARIPALLEALDDIDVAVGSRYVRGGRVRNWSPTRRLISRCGNLYVRLLLALPVHDTTAGFKAYRRAALERIGVVESASNGYCFQVENTWRAVWLGLRVTEVPITFTDRTAGTFKMTGAIVVEALTRVLIWRWGELRHRTKTATDHHQSRTNTLATHNQHGNQGPDVAELGDSFGVARSTVYRAIEPAGRCAVRRPGHALVAIPR